MFVPTQCNLVPISLNIFASQPAHLLLNFEQKLSISVSEQIVQTADPDLTVHNWSTLFTILPKMCESKTW